MINFFRRIRQNYFSENRFGKYLLYAFGEILLVVVGILIAIQINDWNRDQQLHKEELDSYQLIIADLKRDSTLFGLYQGYYNRYLDTYFEMNAIIKGQGSFKTIMPDFIVSNIEFSPITKNNHQATIEKLRNAIIREQINNYFGRINAVHQAMEEFNRLIELESRPYFLKEQDVFDNAVVFDSQDKTFPPLKRISAIDTLKLKRSLGLPYGLPILSELRMSLGFYLSSLERSMEENHKLIQDLDKSLE